MMNILAMYTDHQIFPQNIIGYGWEQDYLDLVAFRK